MRRLAWVLVTASVWVACGDEADEPVTPGTNGTASTASGGSSAATGATTDTSSATTGAGGQGGAAPPPIAVCLPPCDTPADCAMPMAPAFDADNYTCEDGACRYQGCKVGECQGQLVCRTLGSLDTCVLACTTPSDCAVASPAYDEDNYACEDGGCVYTGCNSTSECQASDANTVCVEFSTGVASCLEACDTAADCDLGQPQADADNYACVDGHCEYTGCNDDAECASLGYVCR